MAPFSVRGLLLPLLLLVLLSPFVVKGDTYLHNPRGSNNKLNEPSNTRRSNNRIFDSQNNANGGYNVGDDCSPPCSDPTTNTYNNTAPGAGQGIMYYYAGSILQVQWTAQHGCNNDNTQCNFVLQYMCDTDPDLLPYEKIRDGTTTTQIDVNAAPNTTAQNGMHENYAYYKACSTRQRNGGLFLADQRLNGNTARFTRQNPGGGVSGYECQEERDYYPYWHPSPWKDIAVFTDDMTMCEYYTSESQNVKAKGQCSVATYNNAQACQANGGTWTSVSHNILAPACIKNAKSRDNHNGNVDGGEMASYNWVIPDENSQACVLRIRYNISTGDYAGWGSKMATAALNGADLSPITDRPSKDWIGLGGNVTGPLKLAIDTDQYGRTFQDRTHVFKILPKPPTIAGTIYNVNVRGRRGNIQQVYPSVEYDLVPNRMTLTQGDYVHFQFTGADSNPNGNEGEGRAMTDRSNLVASSGSNVNYPSPYGDDIFNGDKMLVAKFAYLGQTGCTASNDANDANNCQYLNAASAYFDGGLLEVNNVGTFHMLSTRNNRFSNRSQKAVFTVVPWFPAWAIAVIVVGSLGVLGAATVFGVRQASFHMAANPEGKMAGSKFGQMVLATNRIIPFGAPIAYLVPDDEKEVKPSKFREFWARQMPRIRFLTIYMVFNVGFYFYGFIKNLDGPSMFFPMAKGGGSLLNFNCSLILFPVMRNLISWLRLTPLGDVVPLDDNINFHMVVAFFIFVGGSIHIIGHYLNYKVLATQTGVSISSNAFSTYYGITGHILLILMFFVFITAATPLRRKTFRIRNTKIGGYDIFWYVHYLYIPIFVILWIHGPYFFMWSVYPLALFIIEKFIRNYRGKEETQIVRVHQLASDVMCIQMRKRDFHFKAGQYLYLNCPELSKTEWHPFTITSAPEEELFSVHIRCRGDWTSGLRAYLNPANKEIVEFSGPAAKAQEIKDGASTSVAVPVVPMIKTDGPYGSASEHVFGHEVVMLVGAGIGVTPFASIMKSISIRHKARSGGPVIGVPKRVYFYWICGDEQEFSWFKHLIKDIENDPVLAPIISLNTFMTGELNLQELKNDRMSVNMKYAGRPNWRRIFKEHQQKYEKQEIGIFYCGPIPLAQDIANTAAQFSSMNGTRFTFRKENF